MIDDMAKPYCLLSAFFMSNWQLSPALYFQYSHPIQVSLTLSHVIQLTTTNLRRKGERNVEGKD